MAATLVMLNNWMHDFSAAGWVVGSILVWWVVREAPECDSGRSFAARVVGLLMSVMRWSLAGVVGFGVVRALTYRQFEYSEAAGDGQLVVLGVKHVLLTVVFVYGVIWYLKGRRFLRA
jgi:uncharacterized membrane protein